MTSIIIWYILPGVSFFVISLALCWWNHDEITLKDLLMAVGLSATPIVNILCLVFMVFAFFETKGTRLDDIVILRRKSRKG